MKRRIKNIAVLLFVSWIFSGCITAKKCNQRFPPVITKETIIRDTTVYTETTKFDTIVQLTKEITRDTMFFHDLETQIKIKYLQLPGDSIYLTAECPPVTVTITKEIVTNNVETRIAGFMEGPGIWIIIIVGVCLLALAIGYFIKQIMR